MHLNIASLAAGAFVALGGVTILLHAAAKYAPEELKQGLIFVMAKYPTLKHFVSDHAEDLKAIARALEKAEEDAIDAASEKDEGPKP